MTLLQVLGLFIFPIYLWEYFAQIYRAQHTEPPSWRQPRSQGLSSLPSLVVGRKTLVAAGHVTTQNWVAKKSVWWEGWQSYLFNSLYRGSNFADEESYTISAIFKI